MSEHFINLLDELQRRSLRMAGAVESMLHSACEAVARLDETLARRIIAQDDAIDQEEVGIEAEALRLMTLFQPMGTDMRQLCAILKINSDLERIADCAVNIAERARHLDLAAVDEAGDDLKEIYPMAKTMLHNAIRAYAVVDKAIAEQVRDNDDVIDTFYGEFIKKLAARTAESPGVMAARLDVLSIAKNLERIADHATNIAEDVIYLATGRIVRHSDPEPRRPDNGV